MKCRYNYCEDKDHFIVHEYEGLLRLGKCKSCGRITIETLDGSSKPYQVYSKHHINNISEQIISKWSDYSCFKLTFIENKLTGETKVDIYYPYEGRLQGERIEDLAFGNAFHVSHDKLERRDSKLRYEINDKVKAHNNSILVKLWRIIFLQPPIPKYKVYEI